MIHRFTQIVLLLLILTPVATAKPLEAPARVIQQISDDIRYALTHQRHQLTKSEHAVHELVNRVFVPNVDFYRIGGLILGKPWKAASQTEKDQFVQAFKSMLIKSYAKALVRLEDWEMGFKSTQFRQNKRKAIVRTMVNRPNGPRFNVYYRMHYKQKRWQVYDVVVEGVSLVTIYRSAYAKRIRERGFGGLLADMSSMKALNIAKP